MKTTLVVSALIVAVTIPAFAAGSNQHTTTPQQQQSIQRQTPTAHSAPVNRTSPQRQGTPWTVNERPKPSITPPVEPDKNFQLRPQIINN